MAKVFKIANASLEFIITLVLLLILTKLDIIKVRENKTDFIFYILPLVVACIKNIKFLKNGVKKTIIFFKNLISKNSVYWEFVMEYSCGNEIDTRDIYKIIDVENCKKYYKTISLDIQSANRTLVYMDGLRFDIRKTSSEDKYDYIISFSAESPPRSYKSKHEKLILKPFFNKFENTRHDLSTRKYSVKASKALIHEEIMNDFLNDSLTKDFDLIRLKATYKSKTENNTFININDQSFNCVSDKVQFCFDSFNEYILVV